MPFKAEETRRLGRIILAAKVLALSRCCGLTSKKDLHTLGSPLLGDFPPLYVVVYVVIKSFVPRQSYIFVF